LLVTNWPFCINQFDLQWLTQSVTITILMRFKTVSQTVQLWSIFSTWVLEGYIYYYVQATAVSTLCLRPDRTCWRLKFTVRSLVTRTSLTYRNNVHSYIGETGRKLGIKLQKHRMKVDSKNKRTFTRSQRTASLSEHNKSALTDHEIQENHVIDWAKTTEIDREPQRPTRWIKKSVHIRKEGQQAMNRDESSYQLSHMTAFLTRRLVIVPRSKRIEYQLLLMKESERGRNVNDL